MSFSNPVVSKILEVSRTVFSAPAKINLTLNVLGRRPDGYHQIDSIIAFACDVSDTLSARPSSEPRLKTTGPFASDIKGRNLIEDAIGAVQNTAPSANLIDVILTKNIPVSAGLGGGSANAAAALRALKHVNEHNINWDRLARMLSADVPVCMESKAAWVGGFGDKITKLQKPPPFFAVLVNAQAPPPGNKTARVFSSLNAPQISHDQHDTLSTHDVSWSSLENATNDLEQAAIKLMPEIETLKSVIKSTSGCLFARLSGAGPTCFGLYVSKYDATSAATQIKNDQPNWWVEATALK